MKRKAILPAAWTMARKDLRLYFRDRSAALLGFALPIALVTVFGFVMKIAFGGQDAMGRVELWMVDADGSARSAAFVGALRDSATIRLRPRLDEDAVDEAEARALIADGEAHHAMILDPGFGATVEAGELPAIRMLRDPGRALEDRIIGYGLLPAFLEASEGKLWPAQIERGMLEAGMDAQAADGVRAAAESMRGIIASFAAPGPGGGEGDAASAADPTGSAAALGGLFDQMVPVEAEDLAPPERPKMLTWQLAQTISGMMVMMLMFGLVAAGSSLIVERETGSLARLLVAPVARDAILLGKFLFVGIVGLLQIGVLLVYGEAVFRVGMFRDPATLAVLVFTLTLAVTSFGILVAAWAGTTKQAEGLSTLVILVMSALGGAWFPIQLFELPLAAQIATRCTLTHWAMSGFQQMLWNQKNWMDPDVLGAVGVQLGFALVAIGLAQRLFRRRYVGG
ncbi:MAG TPA: ABC transporter permease [Planctomycetota bacterium]